MFCALYGTSASASGMDRLNLLHVLRIAWCIGFVNEFNLPWIGRENSRILE